MPTWTCCWSLTDDRRAGVVLLDLGGVLIHVHFERALAHWAACAGLEHDALSGRFAPDQAYEHHERGELDFAAYASHLRTLIGVSLDDAELLSGWNAALGDAMDGAHALVHTLAAQCPVYLFSNSNAAHYAHWADAHAALLAPMTGVFVSHQVGARKPDAHAFARVIERIGMPASEVAFFDDLSTNVDGARQAGLMAWQVTGPREVAHILGAV